jgi:hypothetical protein
VARQPSLRRTDIDLRKCAVSEVSPRKHLLSTWTDLRDNRLSQECRRRLSEPEAPGRRGNGTVLTGPLLSSVMGRLTAYVSHRCRSHTHRLHALVAGDPRSPFVTRAAQGPDSGEAVSAQRRRAPLAQLLLGTPGGAAARRPRAELASWATRPGAGHKEVATKARDWPAVSSQTGPSRARTSAHLSARDGRCRPLRVESVKSSRGLVRSCGLAGPWDQPTHAASAKLRTAICFPGRLPEAGRCECQSESVLKTRHNDARPSRSQS